MFNFLSSSKRQDSSPQGPQPARPADEPDLTPIFQSWHEYNKNTAQWEPVLNAGEASPPDGPQQQVDHNLELTLATWNVDAFSPLPANRLSAIFSRMVDHAPPPDVIFLQEVCKAMVPALLNNERVRKGWYSSERDTIKWGGQLFATMVLLSKSRFGHLGRAAPGVLGRISRIKYRTRYGRDALCSEVLLPSNHKTATMKPAYQRVQLVNVHLDSLAVIPSRRPHQLSVVSTLLHDVGHGLVAGDFNPVLPEDQTLIEENNLLDAWKAVHGEEPGYTWGVDGTAPFPPNRMDRVAMVGLKPLHMEVMHPENIVLPDAGESGKETVAWSDHSGLKCTFVMSEE